MGIFNLFKKKSGEFEIPSPPNVPSPPENDELGDVSGQFGEKQSGHEGFGAEEQLLSLNTGEEKTQPEFIKPPELKPEESINQEPQLPEQELEITQIEPEVLEIPKIDISEERLESFKEPAEPPEPELEMPEIDNPPEIEMPTEKVTDELPEFEMPETEKEIAENVEEVYKETPAPVTFSKKIEPAKEKKKAEEPVEEEKEEETVGKDRDIYTFLKVKRETPSDVELFVDIDEYETSYEEIGKISEDLKSATTILTRVKDIDATQLKLLTNLHDDLEFIQEKLIYTDKVFFQR